MQNQAERQRIAELELQQARYEASLAERRYAACDPDNRLIAAQLEKSWETALRRVAACEARLREMQIPDATAVAPDFAGLAHDLEAAWNAPGVTMRTRQRLLRALVTDIVADVDDATREVVLTIHWRGGQHSQLRVRKPKSGEHGCRTPDDALAVMRTMATRWRAGGRAGHCCARAKRSPVSRRARRSNSNVSRGLKKGGIMNASSQSVARCARRYWSRSRCGRRQESAPAHPNG
jgi:hypothetical protein